MPRATVLLLIATTATAAAATRTPPPPVVVSDREAVRLLAAEYEREPARLKGDWTARDDTPALRRVCADSGAQPRERRIAVCTVPKPNGGGSPRIDLFVLRAGATARAPAELRTRFRAIDGRGVDASAGDVGFLPLGPSDTGFVITRHDNASLPRRSWQTLYAEVGGQLRDLLVVTSSASNRGSCTPSTSRRCRKRLLDLDCTLQADASRVENGFYPLQVQVTGTRGGDEVDRRIAVPRDAYGYRVSARELKSRGCDVDR